MLFTDTEQIYFDTHKKVLSRYGKTYTDEMRVKVMGTVPRDTYSIFIEDYELPVELSDFYAEVMKELVGVMEFSELMPGTLIFLLISSNRSSFSRLIRDFQFVF